MEQLLFESNPSSMLIYDLDTLRILKINNAFHHKYKYSSKDIERLKLTIKNIHPAEAIPDLEKALKNLPAKGVHDSGIHRHLSKEGDPFLVQITSQNFPYEGHNARLVVCQDLTERIEAEEKSLQAFENLQHHISNSPLAAVSLDHNFHIVKWSQRAENISGYDEDEVTGKSLSEALFYENERKENLKKEIELLVSGTSDRKIIESKVIHKNGEPIFIRIHTSARRDAAGKFKSALALIEDLTEQRRVFTQYKKLFESARDGIYLFSKDGRIVECNQQAANQLNMRRKDLIGKKAAPFSPELQSDGQTSEKKSRKMTIKALKEGYSSFEWRIRTPEGKHIDVELSLNVLELPNGTHVQAVARDITEKKEMQAKLKQSEELFRNLFLKSPAALVMVNANEQVEIVNESFEEMFGYNIDEIVGKDIDQLIIPCDGNNQVPNTVGQEGYVEEDFQMETMRLTKSGEQKHVIAAGMPVYVDGKVVAGFGMYIDITDRKKSENELANSLEEKQVMLEEIHHRVKNNLAVISGILQLQSFGTDDENCKIVLNDSQLRIKSIALVHEMMYKSENFSNISFSKYLKQLLGHIRENLPLEVDQIGVNIEAEQIELSMSQAIPCALMINEMVTNAYKHAFNCSQNGKIDIVVRNDNQVISLTVADNGVGLKEDFDIERNNSLGFNLIKTLAAQLEGTLNYRNGDGAAFTLRFST